MVDPVARYSEERPHAIALVHDDRQVSWAELDARANGVAGALRKKGVADGDRIAVALRNSVDFFELLAGAGRIGATVVPVSFRFKRDEVEYMVGDSKAFVIVAEPANAAEYAALPGTIFRGEAAADTASEAAQPTAVG